MAEVSYLLTIGGAAAPATLVQAIQRLESEEHASMASIMRLSIGIAVTEGGEGWTVVDDDTFPRLTEIGLSIKVGSASPEPILSAYVVETRAVFAESPSESSLEVVAIDSSALMNLEEKIRAWPNMSDSDIAESIFREYGLRAVVDTTEPTRNEDDVIPIQRGTDIQFLRTLADRNGFELYVATTPDGSEGHFHAPKLEQVAQGVLTVGFGGAGNVAALTVFYDALSPTKARADQLAAESQEVQSGSADTVALPSLGGTSVLADARQRNTLLTQTGLVDAAELQAFAQAVVDRSSWAIRAEGELSTMRYEGVLRARKPVSVRGAGPTLSGTYYVERVLHAFTEEGYTQQFTLRRNALSLTGSETFSDDRALPS